MAVTVKITETYDMKTSVGKIGVVGVHTPRINLLQRLYPGLVKNFKFVRFMKCDVVGACASMLPLDPLQVGVEAGDVAPEDTFNPILYTAVTNTSFDNITARIRGVSLTGEQVYDSVQAGDLLPTSSDETANFNTYYALLADDKKFRKSMPQSGFRIRGLIPLAHTLVTNYGQLKSPSRNYSVDAITSGGVVGVDNLDVPNIDGSFQVSGSSPSYIFRGKSVRMPKFPLHQSLEAWNQSPSDSAFIPETYVMAMILPPARLHEFYYRMRVSWVVRFEGLMPSTEVATSGALNYIGQYAHDSNYQTVESDSKMETNLDMVSSDDVFIEKIMES